MRIFLLLLVFAVLAVFVLQNVSPIIPLTILGLQTIALPLSVWILGAIAAGAVTALITGSLIRLGGGRPPRKRSSRRGSGRGSSPDPDWTPPSWTGRTAETKDSFRASSRSRSDEDDWGTSSSEDDWDDWARGGSPRPQTASHGNVRPPVTPPIRDVEFRPLNVETVYPEPDDEPSYGSAYSNDYASYETVSPSYNTYDEVEEEPEREVWDDWEEEAGRSQPPPPPPPPVEEVPPARDIVEIRRDPQNTERMGTIYSFSYRPDDEPAVTPEEPAADTTTVPAPPETAPIASFQPLSVNTAIQDDEVEDTRPIAPTPAEEEPRIRVIIPPYRPEPPPPPEPMTTDWEEEDDEETWINDNQGRDGRGREDDTPNDDGWEPRAGSDREVWDDWDDWDDEDDEPKDSPPQRPSPRSPNGTPPLKF